jgi:protein-L-isoaspartate(D-aspartate) O-methyltransferase
MNFEQARINMIEQQVRPWDVLDQRVLNALADVPREKFLPEAYDGLAYSDTRIPLDNNRISLNPNIEARLLQAAVLESDDRALIIGSGSGYIAACAAKMCKHVESIDTSEEANEAAQQSAASCGIDNIKFITGDLIGDLPDKTTYDAIIVNGSLEHVPERLKTRLSTLGRLIVTVGTEEDPIMETCVIRRIGESDWLEQSIFDTHIPALIKETGDSGNDSFVF